MTEREDRLISEDYFDIFIKGIESEMGSYSRRMILKDAGMERDAYGQPTAVAPQELKASNFAAVQAALRAYYGTGARGSLNRIGRQVWQQAIAYSLKGRVSHFVASNFMSELAASRAALTMLANLMKTPGGDVTVHLYDTDLIFMDTSSDGTFDQEADQPICWYTLGLIQACLAWVTGREINVEEISCRAMGAEACKFKIDL